MYITNHQFLLLKNYLQLSVKIESNAVLSFLHLSIKKKLSKLHLTTTEQAYSLSFMFKRALYIDRYTMVCIT